MSDLYELIKRRQDELRGREEDWIDRFVAWTNSVDWFFVGFWAVIGLPTTILFWVAVYSIVKDLIS